MAEDTNMRTAQFSNRRMLPAPGEVTSAGWGQQIAENTAALGRHAYLNNELAWQWTAPFNSPSLKPDPFSWNLLVSATDVQAGIIRHDDDDGWFGEWSFPIPIYYPYGKSHLGGMFRFRLTYNETLDGDSNGTLKVCPFVKSTLNGLSEDGESITRAEWGRKVLSGTVFNNDIFQGEADSGNSLVVATPFDRQIGLNPFNDRPGAYGTAHVGILWDFGYGTHAVYGNRMTIEFSNMMIYSAGTAAPGEVR